MSANNFASRVIPSGETETGSSRSGRSDTAGTETAGSSRESIDAGIAEEVQPMNKCPIYKSEFAENCAEDVL